jgi:hypothetical protein
MTTTQITAARQPTDPKCCPPGRCPDAVKHDACGTPLRPLTPEQAAEVVEMIDRRGDEVARRYGADGLLYCPRCLVFTA